MLQSFVIIHEYIPIPRLVFFMGHIGCCHSFKYTCNMTFSCIQCPSHHCETTSPSHEQQCSPDTYASDDHFREDVGSPTGRSNSSQKRGNRKFQGRGQSVSSSTSSLASTGRAQLTDMPKEWWLRNSHYQLAVIEWARQEWVSVLP